MTTQSQSVATLTLRGQLLNTRFVFLYFGLLLLTPPLAWLGARDTARRMHTPRLGLFVSDNVLSEIDPVAWPTLRDGDQLLAIDHLHGEGNQLQEILLALRPGPVTLTVRREGREFDVASVLRPATLYQRINWWVTYGNAVACIVIGLVAFLLRPGVRVTWLFLAFCFDVGALELAVLCSRSFPALATRLILLTDVFSASLGMHLFSEFPRRADFLSARPRLAWWFYFPAIPVAAVALLYPDDWPDRDWMIAFCCSLLWSATSAFFTPTNMIIMYRRGRHLGDQVLQAQYRILFIGTTIGLVIPTLATATQIVFKIGSSLGLVSTSPVMIFVACTGYALVRYNAFGVDRFTAAVVGYGATAAVVGGLLLTVLFGLPILASRFGLANSPEVLVVGTGLLFLGAFALSRKVKPVIDRFFFRGELDQSRLATALGELTRVVHNGDREQVLGSAINTVNVLKTDLIELWTLDPSGQLLLQRRGLGVSPPGAPTQLSRDGPLASDLRTGTGGLDSLSHRPLSFAAQQELWSLGLCLAAPINAHGVLAGLCGVGRKLSGTAYLAEDAAFLAAVASHVGMALERDSQDSAKFGRFRIEKRLGLGGMAEVSLAWQVGLGGFERKVALKRPLAQLMEDPQAVNLFLDEARIAAQLQHRHIVQVYEVDRLEGTYYIAMEYVDGVTLRELLRAVEQEAGRVPVEIALAIIAAVLSALAYAHAVQDATGQPLAIVHRDVTPSNILLSRGGEVKLVDFGIARSATRLSVTRTGLVRGTVAYMSPEQARGEDVDARSDLYMAASVLYELLTSQRPFPEGPLGRLPELPSRVNLRLPAALDAVLMKALASSRDDRFESAQLFRQALIEALAPVELASEQAIALWLEQLKLGGASFSAADGNTATVAH